MSKVSQIFILAVVMIFVGPGINVLNKTELVQSNFQLIFLVVTVPFLTFMYLITTRALRFSFVISQNFVTIGFFVLLHLLPIFYMLLGSSYHERGKLGDFSQPVHLLLSVAMFLVALMIGSLDSLRQNLNLFLTITACLSASGNIIQGIYPQFSVDAGFTSTGGYIDGFYNQRNVSAMTIALLCAASLRYSHIGIRDFALFNLCGIAVIFTLSRQGMIMMFLLGMVMTLSFASAHKRKSGQILVGALALLGTLLLISVVWNHMSEFEWIKEGTLTRRFIYLSTSGFDAFFERDRTSLVETALERFCDSPVFGHGYLFHSTSAFGYAGPHNEFLKYALDFGVLGFLTYLAFLATAIRTFWNRKFFRGVFFGLLMAIASFGTHNMMETRPLIILMALLLGESVTKPCFWRHES